MNLNPVEWFEVSQPAELAELTVVGRWSGSHNSKYVLYQRTTDGKLFIEHISWTGVRDHSQWHHFNRELGS